MLCIALNPIWQQCVFLIIWILLLSMLACHYTVLYHIPSYPHTMIIDIHIYICIFISSSISLDVWHQPATDCGVCVCCPPCGPAAGTRGRRPPHPMAWLKTIQSLMISVDPIRNNRIVQQIYVNTFLTTFCRCVVCCVLLRFSCK